MPEKSPEVHVIRRAAQLKALASPPRLQVVEAFSTLGPSTIKQVAQHIGRVPASLYYHVQELARVGLLVRHGQVRSGRRSETVFRLVAPRVSIDPNRTSAAYRRALGDTCRALVRLAERDFMRALETSDYSLVGQGRSLLSRRMVVNLSRTGLHELNQCINRLTEIAKERHQTRGKQKVAVTIVLTPL